MLRLGGYVGIVLLVSIVQAKAGGQCPLTGQYDQRYLRTKVPAFCDRAQDLVKQEVKDFSKKLEGDTTVGRARFHGSDTEKRAWCTLFKYLKYIDSIGAAGCPLIKDFNECCTQSMEPLRHGFESNFRELSELGKERKVLTALDNSYRLCNCSKDQKSSAAPACPTGVCIPPASGSPDAVGKVKKSRDDAAAVVEAAGEAPDTDVETPPVVGAGGSGARGARQLKAATAAAAGTFVGDSGKEMSAGTSPGRLPTMEDGEIGTATRRRSGTAAPVSAHTESPAIPSEPKWVDGVIGVAVRRRPGTSPSSSGSSPNSESSGTPRRSTMQDEETGRRILRTSRGSSGADSSPVAGGAGAAIRGLRKRKSLPTDQPIGPGSGLFGAPPGDSSDAEEE